MRRMLSRSVAALALMAGPTLAGPLVASPALAGAETDINQSMEAVQEVLNAIGVVHDNTTLSQEGTNLANVINAAGLDDMNQIVDGIVEQDVANSVATSGGMVNVADQTGVNGANILDAASISTANQLAQLGFAQGVSNAMDFGYWINASVDHDAVQSGTNLANIANVESALDIYQYGWGDQEVVNAVAYTGAGDAGDIRNIVQEATNLNSVMTGGTIDDIAQNTYTFQDADNGIVFGQTLAAATQAATNMANVVNVTGTFDIAQQDALGMQTVVNHATYAGLGGGAANGTIDGLSQSGVNGANILSAGVLPSMASLQEVTQNGTMIQSVSNALTGMGSTTGLSQTGTNIQNVVSVVTDAL